MNKYIQRIHRQSKDTWFIIPFVVLFGVAGALFLSFSKASTPAISLEAESSTVAGQASIRPDSNASAGQSLQFGSSTPSILPKKMVIYYGDPAAVNGSSGNITTASSVFSNYDLVIFGENIEQTSSTYHTATQSIIQNIQSVTDVYGYIDTCVQNPQSSLYRCSNFSLAELKSRTDLWKAMGVKGIFLDQAGCDYVVSRDRLNSIVDYIHAQGMSAFVNVWNLPDAFEPGSVPSPYSGFADCNPSHLATSLGPNDYALLESWAVIQSDWSENFSPDPNSLRRRGQQMVQYKNTYGTKAATVNTIATSNPPFNQAQFDYTWWATYVYGLDAMAWGETWVYSSDTNALPFHVRPAPANVGQAVSPLTFSDTGTVITRQTTAGTISVNTSTHTGSFTP